MVRTPLWKKNLLLFCGLMENLIFTGNILGWSALNHMLKREGVYEHYCHYENVNEFDFLHNFSNASVSILGNHEKVPLNSNLTLYNLKSFVDRLDNYDQISNSVIRKKNYEDVNDSTILPINDSMETLLRKKRNASSVVYDLDYSTDSFMEYTTNAQLESTTQLPSIKKTVQYKTIKICKKQDTILNLAFTIGSFLNGFTAFVWGFLLDKWGIRLVRLLINFFLTAGCALLCFTSRENSFLIFPAVSLLCLGGVPLRIADMQFANYFPKKRSSVITFYSGAFSASAIVFVILKFVYEQGISFTWTCSILVFISLLMLPITFFLLPKDKIREETEEENPYKSFKQNKKIICINNKAFVQDSFGELNEIKFSQTKFNRIFVQKNFSPIPPNVVLEKFNYLDSPNYKRKPIPSFDSNNNNPISYSNTAMISDGKLESYQNNQYFNTKNEETSSSDLNETQSLPLKVSLCSIPFLLHQWWFSWLITYMIMYVGSMNLWIKRITEDVEQASVYLKIYGFLQILSLVLAPMAGLLMDYQVSKAQKEPDIFIRKLKMAKAGFWPMMFTTLSLSGILGCKFFNHEIAIYISIVLNTFLRSFLVAVASAYLRIRFPSEHFNKLLGIMSTAGAIVTLLQFPLFIFESDPEYADWVNIFNCFCTMFAFLNPIILLINPLQKYFITQDCKQEEIYLRLKQRLN